MHRAAVLLLALLAPALAGDAPPYPKGESRQTHAGLAFHLAIPEELDPERPCSLVVALHGAGATAESIASWYTDLTAGGDFVVCAPQATGPAWNKPDVEKAIAIVRHLVEALPIDPARLHAAGFSNGGAHLAFLAFTEELPFATACFMGSGFAGGKVPRRAKEGMAVLALAGEQDPAFSAAKQTAERLRGKVRWTGFLSQPDLGHEIPDRLIPFHHTFLKAMEGRLGPGEGWAFPFVDDLEAAREEAAERKLPAFLYLFDERRADDPDERRVANEVLFDPLVQHFGRQIVAAKIDVEIEEEYRAGLDLERTPAIVLVKPDFSIVHVCGPDVTASDLAKRLRALAPDKGLPR